MIHASFIHDDKPLEAQLQFDQYEPHARANVSGIHNESRYLLPLKTTRTFAYIPLNAVSKDTDKTVHVLWEETKNGVTLQDVKNWFVNRYLYSAHQGALSDAQLANFELAKQCFSALNPTFAFSRVVATSNEILVKTPSGEIYYEYLSSGFKSCLSILFGNT